MSAEEQVKNTIENYSDAIRNKDAAAVAGFYGAEAIGFDLAAPLVQDSAILHNTRHAEAWFKTWDGPINTSAHQMTTHVSGDLAAVYALIHMTGRKKDGENVDLWFRTTAVLKRQGGDWKIIHVHNSVPFAMDGSGKALLDLKPDNKEAI